MQYDNSQINRAGSLGGAGVGQATAYERAQTSPSVPAVHQAQESLDKAVMQLHELLGHLESRLGPVLAPVPLKGEKMSEPCPPTPHNIASRISNSASSVADAARRVSYMLERLEI